MSGLHTSGDTKPVWLERDDLLSSSTPPKYSQLKANASTDVLVVGGGIAGLHIAYELLTTGMKKVILVEDGKIGSGETGRTTGHLSTDNEWNEFPSMHGKEGTANIAAAQHGAIERIAEIVNKHKIDCDFARVPGYMFHGLPKGSEGYEEGTLEEIYQSALETKKLDIAWVDDAQIKGFESGKAIKYNAQATFHPTKYIRALARIITEELGGTIHEQTRMTTYTEEADKVTAELGDGSKITAEQMVMATNVPEQKLIMIDRLEAFRTYAVALKIPNSALSTNGESALWWDVADPYHYVRITPHKQEGYSLLVVGGEDEKVGQHDDHQARFDRLVKWAKERWSGSEAVEYEWSGQVWDSADGIAYIGLNPGEKRVYIHTGDNGDGLTYAAVGGMLIRDLILGKENDLAHTFSPSRQHSTSHMTQALKSIPHVIKENLMDQAYYLKWASTATKTMTDIEDLVPGQGDVVREGIHPVAVYKDDGGEVHKMTAICPHLHGIVAWNSAEKSFDCPIHGSRFSCKGELLIGPAKGGLEKK